MAERCARCGEPRYMFCGEHHQDPLCHNCLYLNGEKPVAEAPGKVETPDEVCTRLGIDIPGWAAQIRKRVADALGTEEPGASPLATSQPEHASEPANPQAPSKSVGKLPDGNIRESSQTATPLAKPETFEAMVDAIGELKTTVLATRYPPGAAPPLDLDAIEREAKALQRGNAGTLIGHPEQLVADILGLVARVRELEEEKSDAKAYAAYLERALDDVKGDCTEAGRWIEYARGECERLRKELEATNDDVAWLDAPLTPEERAAFEQADATLDAELTKREHVALMRISGILCDAGDVVVEPYPEAVAELVRQRDVARAELAAARGENERLQRTSEKHEATAATHEAVLLEFGPPVLAHVRVLEAELAAAREVVEAAREIRDSGYDGPWIGDACERTYAALARYDAAVKK